MPLETACLSCGIPEAGKHRHQNAFVSVDLPVMTRRRVNSNVPATCRPTSLDRNLDTYDRHLTEFISGATTLGVKVD